MRRVLPALMTARVRSAARMESGLALYASLTTVTPSGREWTSIRQRLTGRAVPSRSATVARSSHLERGGRGAQRVGDVVLPDQAELHRRARPAGVQDERGAPGVVEPDLLGPDVGVRGLPGQHHPGALRGALPISSTRRSSALSTTSGGGRRTAAPPRRARPWPARSPRPMPNSPRCAVPTLSSTATCGRARPQRNAMWPTPRAEYSSTAYAGVGRAAQQRERQAELVVEGAGGGERRPRRAGGRAGPWSRSCRCCR